MHSVVEMPEFMRKAKLCGLTDNERAALILYLAEHPRGGDEMPGTGGARKLRFAKDGKGKRGGYRVITFFGGDDIPVFLLSIFTKNEKSDLSQSEKNELRKLLHILPQSYRSART